MYDEGGQGRVRWQGSTVDYEDGAQTPALVKRVLPRIVQRVCFLGRLSLTRNDPLLSASSFPRSGYKAMPA